MIDDLINTLVEQEGLSYAGEIAPILAIICLSPEAISSDMADLLLAPKTPRWKVILQHLAPVMRERHFGRIRLSETARSWLTERREGAYQLDLRSARDELCAFVWNNYEKERSGEQFLPRLSKVWLPYFIPYLPVWVNDPDALDDYAQYLSDSRRPGDALTMKCRAHDIRYKRTQSQENSLELFTYAQRQALSSALPGFVERYANPLNRACPGVMRCLTMLANLERLIKSDATSGDDKRNLGERALQSLIMIGDGRSLCDSMIAEALTALKVLNFLGEMDKCIKHADGLFPAIPTEHRLFADYASALIEAHILVGNMERAKRHIEALEPIERHASPSLMLSKTLFSLLSLNISDALETARPSPGTDHSRNGYESLLRISIIAYAHILSGSSEALTSASRLIGEAVRLRQPWGFSMGQILMGQSLALSGAEQGTELITRGYRRQRGLGHALGVAISRSALFFLAPECVGDEPAEALAFWQSACKNAANAPPRPVVANAPGRIKNDKRSWADRINQQLNNNA